MPEAIDFRAVSDWEDAQALAQLRNECREYMTGSTELITEETQWRFWEEQLKPGSVRAWLMEKDEKPVGYSLLRPDSAGRAWMSCGLGEAHRGRRLGGDLVRFVTAMGHQLYGPVWLEVWNENNRAMRLYERTGYRIVYVRFDKRLVIGMVHCG